MEPVIKWTFKAVSPSVDEAWELVLKSRDNVVEGESIGAQVNPSGVSCEDS